MTKPEIDKKIAKCEAISMRLENLNADIDAQGAIDEAIDMIRDLIIELNEVYGENERIMQLYDKECENSRSVMRVLKKETEDSWLKKVSGEMESEGHWLQELKLLTEKWELEIAAKKYMCLIEKMNDCSITCE